MTMLHALARLLGPGIRLGRRTLVLCAVLSLPIVALAQVSSPYRITGIVTSEVDGAPVPKCRLTATPSGSGTVRRSGGRRRSPVEDDSPSARTDASGHFTLTLPAAGSWQLWASARGFRRQAYDRHEDFFSAVILTPANPAFDLVFKLEPDSAISGFVVDEAGEAVRNARVVLYNVDQTGADPARGTSVSSGTITDDRGHYEFAGLAPGDYTVGVQAEPWYAAGSQGRRLLNTTGPLPDPSLDLVYPQTWSPGVTDARDAEIFSLHHGEVREADFSLTPAPATHLRIAPPGGSEPGQVFPQIERVSSSQGNPFFNTSTQTDAQGQIDVGGLSPGLYRVTLRGNSAPEAPTFIRVPGGDQRVVDFSSALPQAQLKLLFEPSEGVDRTQVTLVDTASGLSFASYPDGNFQRRRVPDAPVPDGGSARQLELPASQYRVALSGAGDLYLAGMSLNNAPVTGSLVSLGSGSATLTLRLLRGKASVRGVASFAGKPVTGAMVMLVPASFGRPEGNSVVSRDQTNTDGSFLIGNVIPGNYILLAIDNGWKINWHDPSTLARYLIHGLPMTLQPGITVKQDLAAQQP